MIPKKVHYCWFGRGEMPPVVKWCIKSWYKHLPDYEFKLWNEDNFDVNSVPFVKEAYEAKKYAFVADYVRLYALYTEGGIYLDSDERVLKPLDKFLKYDFVASHEFHPGLFKPDRDKINDEGLTKDPKQKIEGLGILAAPLFAKKGHPFIKECLDFYNNHHFLSSEGKPMHNDLIIGWIISKKAEKYGYRYTTKELNLKENGIIFDIHTFVNNALFLNKKTYIIHLGLGSWRDNLKNNRNNPAFEYNMMIFKCKLRKIKHLFLSKEKKDDIMGNWF